MRKASIILVAAALFTAAYLSQGTAAARQPESIRSAYSAVNVTQSRAAIAEERSTVTFRMALANNRVAFAPRAVAEEPRRLRAFSWAMENARGCWYAWGGTGPCADGYDCSGLVYAAYTHVLPPRLRADMPRDTYEMLASPMLRQVSFRDARRGMLAFYGSGHVEMVAYAHNGQIRYTLGAREPGTAVQIWRLNGYFYPTAIYEVVR
jgi:cell wall-associated NlpC family hydrolase